MMINSNYAQVVAQAKANNAPSVNFDNKATAVHPIPGEKDTVTISDKALAMMNGKERKDIIPIEIVPIYGKPDKRKDIIPIEIVPIYVKPDTARSLIANTEVGQNNFVRNRASNIESDSTKNENLVIDNRFSEMM
tara:strand:- start:85 stop:489 length:405 start_codon:yes stop_codon:yes gene_type:complete